MRRLVFNFFLPFFILLFIGHPPNNERTSQLVHVKDKMGSEFALLQAIATHEERVVTSVSSDTDSNKRDLLNDVAEIKVEEDEVHSSKKSLKISPIYVTPFDSKSAVYFFHYLKNRSSLHSRLSIHSSYKSLNVTFGVFRI